MFNTKKAMTELNNFPTEAELLNILNKQYDRLEEGLVYGKAGLAVYYAKLSNENASYKKFITDL